MEFDFYIGIKVVPTVYFIADILTELIYICINLGDELLIDYTKTTIEFNFPQHSRQKKILRENLLTTFFLNALQKSGTPLSEYWTKLNNIDVLYSCMLLDSRLKHQPSEDNVEAKEFLKI